MNTFAKLAYTLAATSALVMAITASAQTTTNPTVIEGVNKVDINAPTPYNAYVQDANGHIVRDAYGDCVHTGYWTPADATVVGCDGYVAPVTAAAQPAPAAKPVPTSEKVTYAADTFFDFDKSVLKPAGKHALNELIAKLKHINVEAIVATGHTDAIGTVAYNQKLSVRRAEAVKHYMVEHGVHADRIYVSGKGKSQPIATNKTAAGRAKNRRVDVEVVGTRTSDGSVQESAPHHRQHHEKHHNKPHHETKHHNKPHHETKHHTKPHHAPKAQPAQPAAQPQ